MIINLTNNDVDLYGDDTPDRIEPGADFPVLLSIPTSGRVARIREHAARPRHRYGAETLACSGVQDVIDVEFGHVDNLPDTRPDQWLIVSLACALALPGRRDLLVPYRQVRNMHGVVIGCRALARPC